MIDMEILSQCLGFEWDEGNNRKNWVKHQVTLRECEEVFFNSPLLILKDAKHSEREERYYLLGCTNQGRRLSVVFVIRNLLILVISACDMSKRERGIYEKENTKV